MAGTAFQRFVVNQAGIRAVLRSSGVRDDLQQRAESVRRVAQGATDRELTADSYIGRNRAGATVIGVSMAEEIRKRVLGGAIDAARR